MIAMGEYQYDASCYCKQCEDYRFPPAGQAYRHTVTPISQEKIVEGNRKLCSGKTPMGDLDLTVLEVVARVFEHGNKKYATDNHLKPGVASVRQYASAAMRHMAARQRGEKLDPESGVPHLAHAIASLMIALRHDSDMTPLDSFWEG